jgi:hypothetical protein
LIGFYSGIEKFIGIWQEFGFLRLVCKFVKILDWENVVNLSYVFMKCAEVCLLGFLRRGKICLGFLMRIGREGLYRGFGRSWEDMMVLEDFM